MRKILFILLLLAPTLAQAQEVAIDALGIRSYHWNCPAWLSAVRSHPGKIGLGAFLDDTFVDKTKRYDPDACLKATLATGKISFLRGHLAWTNHQTLAASALALRAQFLNALAAAYGSIRFYGSAICEHYMTAQQSAALNASLRPLMPLIKGIVDSGVRSKDPAALPEVHSNRAKGVIVSQDGGTNNDGNGMWDVDIESTKKNASMFFFLWDKSLNCRLKDDKRKPFQRTDCPTADQFNHIVRLTFPMPPYPAGTVLPPPMIWKPMSDNHGGCKGKDCHPVYITPTRQRAINITTLDGRIVATMNYFGTFQGGGHRYYLTSLTAFQLGQTLERLSGSEFGLLHDGRSRFVFNAYRRGGASR